MRSRRGPRSRSFEVLRLVALSGLLLTVGWADAAAAAEPAAGLVAGWGFDESLGTTAVDVTGNGNTATLQNDPTWTAGRNGGGLRFDGVDDHLIVLSSPSLNLTGPGMTVSMWINPRGEGTGDQVAFGKFWGGPSSTPFYQYGLELDRGLTPHLYIGGAGASMGTPLVVGAWSHLAVVFDGASAQFYVNGSLVSSRPLTATLTSRDSLTYVGSDIRPGQFFGGTLDDVRLYNRAETQDEVRADMSTPLRPPAPDPNAPAVSITSPPDGAIVSGNRTITADASDDTGVAGVQFYVDGTATGPEDTSAPYAADWDTRLVPNGAHTLTARARDTDGTTSVSELVNVTVANTDSFQNQVLATGFDLPTNIEFLPDGRMLVAELAGTIKVLPPPYTTPDPDPWLELTNVGSFGVQQGIFDVALDPDFATNRHYYVFYTLGTPNSDRLSRFTANASLTGTVPGSELVLYQDPGIASSEHHGGAIAFGKDGMLYFTTGDHFQGSPSQDLNSPRGKIHRIYPDGMVPPDNPFYDGAGPHWDSVWAYGLRNPFRAFYDAPTDRLLVADVGGNLSDSNEEIDVGARGANYGWPDSEGQCSAPCTSPLYDYEHNGQNASVTGGFVYHGSQFPDTMRGNYFFADYAQRWIKRMTFDASGKVSGVFDFEPISGNPSALPAGDVVYLTEGPDGALYYVDLGYSDTSGSFGVSKIRRIRYLRSNQAPVARISANPTSGPAPLDVSFSSEGSNDPEGQPLTYSWDFGDGTSSAAASPSHTYARSGRYVVRLTVSDGAESSISTPLTINVGSAPAAAIVSPADGATFRAGDVIGFAGDATDAEDGSLPARAYTWNIDFLHDNHVHPGTAIAGVKSGTFSIPTRGHDFEGDTRYRITLTVTDSDGLQDTRSVIVRPDKVDLTFDAVPSGMTLYVDGVARTTPFVLDTLKGFVHTVEARDQTVGGKAYAFSSWSDGGGQAHDITVPDADRSFTASYAAAAAPGPAAAWAFEEGSGTTTADASGNGNTATLVNGPAWDTGAFGKALRLDGENDALEVPDSASLDISGTALTLSLWINPGTVTGDSVVLGKFWNAGMTSPFYQYGLELSGGRPHFYVGTATGLQGAAMDTALPVGRWSHLAVVFDGAAARFYVDGALAVSRTLTTAITARGQVARLGADADRWQCFKGLLDNVRIYGRSLTASELQEDMGTGIGTTAPAFAGAAAIGL